MVDLAVKILEWVYGKASTWLVKTLMIQEAYRKAREKNQKIAEQTLSAETKEERDAAAQNDINSF